MIYSYALHIVLLYPKYSTAMENLKKVVKIMVSDNIAAPASVLFIIIYISVFILSTVGSFVNLLQDFYKKAFPFSLVISEFSDRRSPISDICGAGYMETTFVSFKNSLSRRAIRLPS